MIFKQTNMLMMNQWAAGGNGSAPTCFGIYDTFYSVLIPPPHCPAAPHPFGGGPGGPRAPLAAMPLLGRLTFSVVGLLWEEGPLSGQQGREALEVWACCGRPGRHLQENPTLRECLGCETGGWEPFDSGAAGIGWASLNVKFYLGLHLHIFPTPPHTHPLPPACPHPTYLGALTDSWCDPPPPPPLYPSPR